MKSLKPLVLSFSLLAFTGAYAQDAKKESDPTAKPAMSQAESKSDKAASQSSQSSRSTPSSQSSPQSSAGASAGASSSAAGAGMADGMSVRKLRGMDVVDAKGEKLGDIEEVMLDMQSGRVQAVVLGFGGFLGLGEKHFAFPVSDLQPAKEKDKLQLNVDKQKLKDREGFAKGKYPEPNDDYWVRIGQADKAGAAAGATGQKASFMRASQVIGKDVEDKSGKDVGEVQDILLSADRTRIQHVVIDVNGAGHATVEPKSLSMAKPADAKPGDKRQADKLVIDMSADQLKSQAKPAERNARTDRTRPATSGSAATGGTRDAETTRTVPIQRDNSASEKPKSN